jgi:hypothetical protein
MITLRCTKKLQQHLGVKPEPEDVDPTSNLGDWYGNLVFMPKSWPLILISNERTMISVVLRHDVNVLDAFKRRVVALLKRIEIPADAVEREAFHLQQVRIGKTRNRRVLGSMNDAVVMLESALLDEPRQSLEQVEDTLARNLYSMLKYEPPADVARGLFGLPARPRHRGQPAPAANDSDPTAAKDKPPAPALDVPTALDILALALDGPRRRRQRKRIAEGQRVPVELSARDCALIVEHTMLDPELAEPLANTMAKKEVVTVRYTLDDLEEILGYVAAEANHCKSKKLQRELDGLYKRLHEVMDSYDDGGWQN